MHRMGARAISLAAVLVVVISMTFVALTSSARSAAACFGGPGPAPAPDMYAGPDCRWYFADDSAPLTEGQIAEANATWHAYEASFLAAVLIAFVIAYTAQRWNTRVAGERTAAQM
jgi:hypothetical protein